MQNTITAHINDRMNLARLFLYDMNKLIDSLTGEFASLPQDKFAGDARKTESALRRMEIMKERWSLLPCEVRRELNGIDWRAAAGRWNRAASGHDSVDPKYLWEIITQRLPEMKTKIEDLLKGH